ncbi:unnamed protein product [Tuber aestivum]|uniref:Uncharacterized protein n=1 Tax=Tuber aestivum TaxID=59557 RepID=A0A292Q792_9PEZI|nr:unnamed protein product [Tuber aestivum]
MPAILPFPVGTLSPMYNKRNYTENQGEGNSDGKGQVVIVEIVLAGLTLLVGIMALRSLRFRRFASYLFPSRCVNALPRDPQPEVPRATTAVPSTDFAGPVISLCFIAPSIPAPNPPPPARASPRERNGVPCVDMRVMQVAGCPDPRGPGRVVTWPGT